MDLYKSKTEHLEIDSLNQDVEIDMVKRVMTNMEAEIKMLGNESGSGS